ncbi:hypothetical protein J2S59_001580 [Nocardioides massiliensis]|uniref:MetS family NSS transporter small subunit n=1 Tax=Nocardioides massiliensis TaxID=1325935 RepID=A0ABT9NMY0_9ACTN|nr:hypothetical protein [Nocardioides massiliensis]
MEALFVVAMIAAVVAAGWIGGMLVVRVLRAGRD